MFDHFSQSWPVDCSLACAGGMSVACCDCLACDQGMRFGKRALATRIKRRLDSGQSLTAKEAKGAPFAIILQTA